MVKSLFFKLWATTQKQSTVGRAKNTPINNHVLKLSDIPRSPPFDTGLPVIGIDLLLQSQTKLISRIRMACAMEDDVFEQKVMRVLRNYAAYVHLLPATKDSFFRGAGDLFRFGLEIGFYSLQSATSGLIFSGREGPENRHKQEPAWRYATFLAGICSEAHRALRDMQVVDDKNRRWPCYQQSLHEWCQENGAERYFICWAANVRNDNIKNVASALLVNSIIPLDCQKEMNAISPKIYDAMLHGIIGANPSKNDHDNILTKTIQDTRIRVILRDEEASLNGRPIFRLDSTDT